MSRLALERWTPTVEAARGRHVLLHRWRPVLVVAGTVAVVVGVHAVNFLGYPYIESDEGTYVAQAWSVLAEGRLAPYTYFYDHAPGGWVQIAVWFALTGGANGAFGDALASARVLMLVVQAVTTVLIVLIGRRVTGSIWAGAVAALLAGLSPYGLPYQRRVLLDDLVLPWMLGAFLVLLRRRPRLSSIWWSAVLLGVAFWTKEIAVVAAPAALLLAIRRAPQHGRLFAAVGWPVLFGSIVSLYPLMAILKGELLPEGWLFGGSTPHVSLVCSLQWQSGRGQDGGLFNPASAFWQQATSWAGLDPLLVIGGSAAAVALVVRARRMVVGSATGLVVLTFCAFVARGGVVLPFYLVPMLPFLALSLVIVVWAVLRRVGSAFPGRDGAGAALTAVAGAVLVAVTAAQWLVPSNAQAFTADPVAGQRRAVEWIRTHLPADSRLIVDMSMWISLHEPADPRDRVYPQAQWYWKVDEDPRTRAAFLRADSTSDYVISDPQLVQDTVLNGFPTVSKALTKSRTVARFDTGWPIEVREVVPGYRSADFDFGRSAGASEAAPPSCMTGT